MRPEIIFSIVGLFFASCINAQIREGQICHADPEVSDYNYAGLWEKFEDGWICNYWQFLNEAEYTEIEIQMREEVNEEERDVDGLEDIEYDFIEDKAFEPY